MSAHYRRARPGLRRDGQVRSIRSDSVRYPGSRFPESVEREYEEWSRSNSRLRPARDTGLAVEGRLSRERRLRERARKRRTTYAVFTAIGVLLLLIGWRYSSDRKAAAQPLPDRVASTSSGTKGASSGNSLTPQRIGGSNPDVPSLGALTDRTRPTPILATYHSLELRLPVQAEDLTEVAFHQASYTYALHLKTEMPDADSKWAKKNKTTRRDLSKQSEDADAWLTGHVLRLWRNRPGKPDSAVDVGAAPGSPVVAPVSGTVIKIKKYSLYGKLDDFEIHIKPHGVDGVDLVMIHVTDLSVKVGDHVSAGKTRIAAVRKISGQIHTQLADYTRGGGNHVHFQLNDTTDPDYEGLKGAIAVR